MAVARSPAANPNMDSTSGFDEIPKCLSCTEVMQPELQECCILETCLHIFHRTCIEQALSNSSHCPVCKVTCELSDLKNYPLIRVEPTEMSSHTGARKKGSTYRGKSRGVARRPVTRNLCKAFDAGNVDTSSNFDIFQRDLLGLREDSQIVPNTADGRLDFPQRPPDPPRQHVANRNSDTDWVGPNPDIVDYDRINHMIENNLARILRGLNIGAQTSGPNPSVPLNNDSRNNPDSNYSSRHNSHDANRNQSNRTLNSDDFSRTMRPDRVTFTIQNWNIQFDGSCNGLSVDEFLYRIRTLTREHLNDNFAHICKNLPILLNGKAKEWYWRYHKSVESIQWNEFCGALRGQFKDLRSDFDLKEAIRGRKMRPGESFDSFYDSICAIADKLRQSIPEEEMVEILIRNLRPEIRHELLYVPIFTIGHLRKLVQMRENLLNSQRAQFSSHNVSGRRNVAELCQDEEATEDIRPDAFVDAIKRDPSTVKCWNCDEIGHYWDDCLKDRTVFCYGCGTRKVYKPQCVRCSSKKFFTGSKNFMSPSPSPSQP